MNLWPFPRSQRARGFLKWLGLAAGVAFLAYRMKFAPVPVLACESRLGPITAEILGTGTLEARVKTTLSPRIQERLAEVLVDQGDAVRAGQLLARLDDGDLKRQVDVAEAAAAGARAALERVRTDEARALAVLKQTQLDHKRLGDLLSQDVSSQAEFDKAQEQLHVAGADVNRSRAAIAEAESQVVTAEKSLAYQRERLTYTQILSPYDGLIVRRDRDPGGVVVPGGSLLQLISTNELWISAWVDETAMTQLAPGQPARVVFRSDPTKSYPGTIARLGQEADRETREFLVDVRVKELPTPWAVGQRAEVFIAANQKQEALLVQLPFVQWREGRSGVMVNSRGRTQWRPVLLGLRGRDDVEILEGLAPGEQVVRALSSRQELTSGQRIRTP